MKQEDLDKIFDNQEPAPQDDDLLQYAADNASDEIQHQVEAAMQDDPFLQDAMDGLSAIKQKEQVPLVLAQLNHKLTKDLRNKQKKQTKGIENINWILLACGVMLLLILAVVYFYLFMG